MPRPTTHTKQPPKTSQPDPRQRVPKVLQKKSNSVGPPSQTGRSPQPHAVHVNASPRTNIAPAVTRRPQNNGRTVGASVPARAPVVQRKTPVINGRVTQLSQTKRVVQAKSKTARAMAAPVVRASATAAFGNQGVVQRAGGHNVGPPTALRLQAHLNRLSDRVDQYIATITTTLNGILGSNVNIYNGNPLMGSLVHASLTAMTRELENRFNVFDRAYEAIQERYGDIIYDAGADNVFDDELGQVADRHAAAVRELDTVAAFFDDYRQWVAAHPHNPMNMPVGGSLFRQYDSAIHPGDMTVRQSMEANDAIAAYNIRRWRHPVGPPSWASGQCGRDKS